MIKTLRITSIVVGVLAATLLVLPALFGVRGDAKIEGLLKSPGAADKYLAAKGNRPARDESQTSPLVKAAAGFHLILEPPPPPPPKPPPPGTRPAANQPAPPVVTPKFNLVGTSYYAGRPELSLALIDEPGKGLNWVRQGSTVGHLTIEQIKDGSITIKDGQGTSEMTVTVNQPWRSLLKNPPPETRPAAPSPADTDLPAAVLQPASPDASQGGQQGAVAPRSVTPSRTGRVRPGFGAKVPPTLTAAQKVERILPLRRKRVEEPVEDATSYQIEQAKLTDSQVKCLKINEEEQ
jgi:hypothetical protein